MKAIFSFLTVMTFAGGALGIVQTEEPGRVDAGSDKDRAIPTDRNDFHIFLLMGQPNKAGGMKGNRLSDDK